MKNKELDIWEGLENPFADVDEMDQRMIKLWNNRVSCDDDVYIIGDFCFRKKRTPDWYLRQLKGHKHLPIADWYNSHRGSRHIYGHIHANRGNV